jgi:hypothetical protein
MRHDLSWKAATKCFAVGLLVLGLTVGLAPVVGAIPISAVDGTWENAVGGANVSINNLVDPRTARWGTTTGSQSGYNFSPAITPFEAPVGTPFSLGTFNHLNFVIASGTSITGIDLNFTMTINGFPPLAGTFNFIHNETPNPAADVVTITSPLLTNTPFDGYFFKLLGFSSDGGTTIVTSFTTNEDAENPADLYGLITPSAIPEPATMLLLGSGLIGLAGYARRRFKK